MILKQTAVFEGGSLSLERGGKKLFQDLSFSLFPEESLVLFGKNGSGKTSLLRLMATLLRPATGHLFWGHKKLTFLDPTLKKNLIYMGHDLGLRTNIRVSEMLSFFKDMLNSEVSIEDVVSYWGLEEFKNRKISEISVGCQKKVALCRLNLNLNKHSSGEKSFLWLLDEPFTNLDRLSQQKLSQIFENHLARGGVLIFSSHQDQLFKVSHRIHLENEFSKESNHA